MPIMPRRLFLIFGAALALSACAMSDDQAARYLVAPNKYLLYTCDDIAREAQTKAARELELQQLMAKASTDATGRLIGDMVYRSEYLSVRGELNELRRTAADKHCAGAPAGAAPAARASDKAAH